MLSLHRRRPGLPLVYELACAFDLAAIGVSFRWLPPWL